MTVAVGVCEVGTDGMGATAMGLMLAMARVASRDDGPCWMDALCRDVPLGVAMGLMLAVGGVSDWPELHLKQYRNNIDSTQGYILELCQKMSYNPIFDKINKNFRIGRK